jgi:hypothetical protein
LGLAPCSASQTSFVEGAVPTLLGGSHYSERAGWHGNPHGNRHHSRHLLNQEFIQALLLHFREHGKKAIEKVAREQPASYLKILALLVPREMKFQHSQSLKSMSDEQLDQAIEALKAMLESPAAASGAVIEGNPEAVALPAPDFVPDDRIGGNKSPAEAGQGSSWKDGLR